MLNSQFFRDLFKVTRFNIFCFAFFDLRQKIFVRKDFNGTIHGIILIF